MSDPNPHRRWDERFTGWNDPRPPDWLDWVWVPFVIVAGTVLVITVGWL